jgi:hypothetical protein
MRQRRLIWSFLARASTSIPADNAGEIWREIDALIDINIKAVIAASGCGITWHAR